MQTVMAMDLVADAARLLKDEGNTRWSMDELLGWLNAGQRAIVARRPDAHAVIKDFECEKGTLQVLPAGALRLLDVVRNTVSGDAISAIDRVVLDNQHRGWHGIQPTEVIEHYAYDERSPKIFWCYPPAIAGHLIDIVHSAAPDTVVVLDGDEPISLDDLYANAILEYMLYRAFQKDAEYGANPQRAGLHWNAFLSEIGDRSKADAAASTESNG